MARKGLDRAVVIECAARLADSAGHIDKIGLAEVAAALNIRIPSLYNHVENLADLRRGVALLAQQELTDTMQAIGVGRAGDEAVLAVARAYRDYAHQYPGRYAATLTAPDADEAELSSQAQRLVNILLQIFRAYGLDETETLHIIRAWRSLVHGFVSLEAAQGFKMALAVDDSFEKMLHLFLRGLRSQA